MGRPAQRAPRLHFRAASVSRENAHGPGHRKHRRARAGGTGESSTGRSRKSCSLARARRCSVRGKSKSCSRRFAVSSVANVQTNRIAFPGEFSCGIPGGGAYNAVAKRVTNSEADGITSGSGLASGVAISSRSK